jgi:hypothetical protein
LQGRAEYRHESAHENCLLAPELGLSKYALKAGRAMVELMIPESYPKRNPPTERKTAEKTVTAVPDPNMVTIGA